MSGHESKLKNLILALALENAVSHGGKARLPSVMNKLLACRPELREEARFLVKMVENIIREINSLDPDEQKRLLDKYSSLLPERKKEREKGALPLLPNARKGKVTTRFSPNPDFVLHLGSARAAILSHDYARMYDGKFILRFEDTDPRTKKPRLEYYDAIREDLKWLECSWDEEYIQSKRLEIYYDVARKLTREAKAYVCTCDPERFKLLISRGVACPCRDLLPDEHLNRLEAMIRGEFDEGEAVLRIKTDLKHRNPSVRDWPALRVIDTENHPHPIVGSRYKAWPLYNFSCAIDDYLTGVTHVIRGIEHKVNEVKQTYVYVYMGWHLPTFVHHGKLSVEGAILSKSKMLEGISKGLYVGIDDPRLATLSSLRRRGFEPEAIRELVYEVGLNPSTATVDWKKLEAYNRRIIDPRANRRSVVLKPYKLIVEGLDSPLRIKLPLHPGFPDRGFRSIHLEPVNGVVRVYVEKDDVNRVGLGGRVRLIGFANVAIEAMGGDEARARIVSADVSEARKDNLPFIHWVHARNRVGVRILWDDARELKGVGEEGLLEERPGNVIQMERIGYAKVESVRNGTVYLIFTHK